MQLIQRTVAALMLVTLAVPATANAVTITWTGGAGTNSWHAPGNWDLIRVPGVGDDVVIPDMTPDVNVTHFTSTTINSLTSAEAFTLNGGTLVINSASSLNGAFALSAALSGSGDVTVNGPMTWTGTGQMIGTGRTIIAAGASLTISDASTKTLIDRTLENHSANVNWTAGQIIFNGGTFINASDGTFTANLAGAASFVPFGGTNVVTNAGTFTKSGAATLTVSIPFNNTGTVNLDAGALTLIGGGGTNSGVIDSDAGTTLTLGNNTHTGSSSLTGQGTLNLSGTTIAGVLGTNRIINISGATFNAPYDFAGTVNLSSGALAGTGDATISGVLNWTSNAQMSGPGKTIIAPLGSLTISDSSTKTLIARTLENHSPNATWSSGVIQFVDGIMRNEAGGILTANHASNLSFTSAGGTNAVTNAGTFNKTGGGTLSCNIPFNNTGTVNLDTGGLSTFAGGTSSGAIDADAGTTLSFGAFTHNASSSLTGQGMLNLSGTTIAGVLGTNRIINISGGATLNAPYDFVGTVNLSSGALAGTGDASISGVLNWTSNAQMSGTGKTIIAPGGTLTISDAVTKTLNRTLENHSANATWTEGNITFINGIFINASGGTFNANTAGSMAFGFNGGTNAVSNAGMFLKTGAGQATIDFSIPFANTGTVNVQSGTLTLTALTNFAGATLTGGTYNVAGILRFTSANIVTNAANIILDGPASAILNTLNANALGDFATNSANASFQIKNGRNFARSGSFSNAGQVIIGPGDNTFSASTFDNSGTVTKSAAGAGSINSTVTQAASGTIDVQGGTLTLSSLTNFSGTVLTGGTYKSAGTLRFGNANIVNNAASIILDGPGSAIENTLGVNGLTNLASNSPAGAIQIRNGRNLALSGDFNNAGQVIIGPGIETLSLPGAYVQSAGLTQLDDGTLDPANPVEIQGGELKGNGSILASVTNSGTCRPGLSAGGISITGDYTQTVSGLLEVEIGGTTAITQYDQLSVSGTAILLGTLRILLINGFEPAIGNTFDIVTGEISTKFATIQMPVLPSLRGFQLEELDASLRLNVINCGPGDADNDGVGDACDTPPDLAWYTIAGGGRTFSSGGEFRVGGTIGQHTATSFSTPLTGGGFTLVGGFWAGTELVEPPACPLPGDMNLDATRNGKDIRLFANCVISGGGAGCDCADMDDNAAVNTNDIAPFVQLLIN